MVRRFLRYGWPAIPGAIAGLVTSLSRVTWPSEAFWAQRAGLVVGSLVVVAVVAVAQPSWTGYSEHRRERERRRSEETRQVLRTSLIEIDKDTHDDLAWHDIGLHVWEVRQRLTWAWPPWRQELRKVASLRVQPNGGPSGIRWTRGKGVIGLCWERLSLVARNVHEDYKNYLAGSPDQWYGQDETFRLGLSWEELQRTKRYGGVLAAPMFDHQNRFRGCVSLDGPPGSYKTLKNQRVHKRLGDIANSCAAVLFRER